jgi:hypothetical protein
VEQFCTSLRKYSFNAFKLPNGMAESSGRHLILIACGFHNVAAILLRTA